jgi:hypothetical protein
LIREGCSLSGKNRGAIAPKLSEKRPHLVGVVANLLLISYWRREADSTSDKRMNILLALTKYPLSPRRLNNKLYIRKGQVVLTTIKVVHYSTVLADRKAILVEVPVNFHSVAVFNAIFAVHAPIIP